MTFVYAEIVRRQGWFVADRVLTGKEYANLLGSAEGSGALRDWDWSGSPVS